MKDITKKAFYLIFIGIMWSILIVCKNPAAPDVPNGPNGDDTVIEKMVGSAYIDILQNKIHNVSVDMEYSLDDKATWTTCSGSTIDVTFAVGNRVWVREISNPANEGFLGEVEALSGRPDLIAWEKMYIGTDYWNDLPYGSPGDTRRVFFWFNNIGDTSCSSADHYIRFYLSTDRIIDAATDTLILDLEYPYLCPTGEVYGGVEDFTVPLTVTAGTYYIGCIIDATDVINELNEGNNVTPPDYAAQFTVKDTSAPSTGAFKFVNSWGTSGTWENIQDGHYWVTYRTMKRQEMMITYYYNDFSGVYEPRVVAVFKLTHTERDNCRVTLGLGDPGAPYIKKELQSREWDGTLISGPEPFPANNIVVDISEFAAAINDYNLFLAVENTGSTGGTIDNFSVEFYSDYDSAPFKTITGGTGSFPGDATTTVTANTKGNLTYTELQSIMPLPRASIGGISFIEEKPTEAELARDMDSAGVYVQGRSYNKILYGRFGTGYQPPTAEQWRNMKKLRGVETAIYRGGGLPDVVDHSATQYFPPIGDQGSEGSCTCFSLGYYIQTFTEAKEHSWNLTGTTWSGSAPASNLDKIFSPDFIYHQINYGGDNGSNPSQAASLIIRLGGATWSEMPYNTVDSVSWPSEDAFREAGRYRGREVGNYYWDYISNGYFIIYDDSDINLLRSLISAGYCVSTSIKAASPGLYDLLVLDSYDVVDDDTTAKMTPIDHAQTIVAYKEGAGWDPTAPDS